MRTKDIAQEIANDCIGVRVRMLNRIVTRVYDDMLRPHGVRFSQMNIMTVVSLRGPIQPVEIGRILVIEKSTISRNVRLMEENGWIESIPTESGNGQLLQLTVQGRSLYKKSATAWRKAQDKLQELLGSQTISYLLQAVNRVQEEDNEYV